MRTPPPTCATNVIGHRLLEIGTWFDDTVQKIQRISDLAYEVGFKELGAIWTSSMNAFIYKFQDLEKVYTFDQQVIKTLPEKPKTAKVILLIHGQGNCPFCMLPLAKKINEFNPDYNVFIVNHKATADNPVPVEQLADTILEITKKCLKKGIKADFTLIGHSLGGAIAAKYSLSTDSEGRPFLQLQEDGMSIEDLLWIKKNVRISTVISVAGRIRYYPNKFWWFCEDIRLEIDKIYQEYQKIKDSCKIDIYTIRGALDELIPSGSVHFQDCLLSEVDSNGIKKERTIPEYGHGGIVYSKAAHKWICEILSNDQESHVSLENLTERSQLWG